MRSLLHFVLTYWPILLLLYLPHLAQLVAVIVATRTRDTLDHEIPDELPQTAGEWLASRISALGIPVDTLVTDEQSDGYRPLDKLIQLSHHTHFKADPVYWATAAHELGHARLRVEAPIVGRLRTIGQFLLAPLLAAGCALLAGYVLNAIPIAGDLAFVCFVGAAATRIFTLLDEALASVLAYRELHANEAIDFVHLRAIRAYLISAFATYFVTYVSYSLLLVWWPAIDALVLPSSIAELTTLGTVVAAALTLCIAVTIVLGLVQMFAPEESGDALEDRPRLKLLSLAVRHLPIVVLVYMVWNVSADPRYIACVIVALAASWRAWHQLLQLPLAIPYLFVAGYVKRFSGPGLHRSPRYVQARMRGRDEVRAGNFRLRVLERWHREDPPFATRIAPIGRLGYLPLLVAFWLMGS